jgi:hypothetical protein
MSDLETLLADLPRPADPTAAGDAQTARLPSREEVRQLERMPDGYKPLVIPGVAFDPRLCFELALGLEDDKKLVFERFGYDLDAAVQLAKNPQFQRMLKFYKDDVEQNGITYKAKVRVQAEALLVDAYNIANDPEAPAAVRADLIKWHGKMAGHEPKQDGPAAGQGNGFQLQIVFSGEAKQEPLTIQGERVKDVLETE